MIQTPWAIILCKFSDIKDVPYDRQRYEEIFTTKGNGKWNMVDFFRDMSHGKLDLPVLKSLAGILSIRNVLIIKAAGPIQNFGQI